MDLSRFDSFDLTPTHGIVWPLPLASLSRVGQSVLADRDGKGRPHYGIDLFAPAGTVILCAAAGRVVRVVDGRTSTDPHRRRAGLWVDIFVMGLLFRYLHLTSVIVTENQTIQTGRVIGFLGSAPDHLHFEIRRHDAIEGKYGDAIDPLRLLPKRST